jgi:hypothetical protein
LSLRSSSVCRSSLWASAALRSERRLASSSSDALETTSSASPIPIRIPTASAMKTAASEAA